MKTFEQALDLVNELPLEQQELLIEIVKKRTIEMHRQELVKSSQEAFAEFKSDNLKVQTAEEAIADLRNYLNDSES